MMIRGFFFLLVLGLCGDGLSFRNGHRDIGE